MINNNDIKIPGYHTYKTRQDINCGTAILIRRALIHRQITTNTDNFLTLKIHTDSGPLLISTAYSPPRDTLNLTLPFHTLKNYNLPHFFIGDINAHHRTLGSTRTNVSGKHLIELINRYKLEYLGPDFYAYFNNNVKSTPDIILRNDHASHINHHAEPGPILLSDRKPIIITAQQIPS